MNVAYWVPSNTRPVTRQFYVEPFHAGKWGPRAPAHQAAERALEVGRPSHLPSRDGSVFVCPTLKACQDGYATWRGLPVYEVETSGREFVTDGNWFARIVELHQDIIEARRHGYMDTVASLTEAVAEQVRGYWSGKSKPHNRPMMEMLVAGKVRVVRQVWPEVRELAEDVEKPQGQLVEREQDWLYHGTYIELLDSIAARGKLIGKPYVSFTEKMRGAFGEVTMVFRKRSILDRVERVQYTEKWMRRNLHKAEYITGDDFFSTRDLLDNPDLFLRRSEEKEWISKQSGSMSFKQGELVAVMVMHDTSSQRAVEAIIHARELFADYLPPQYITTRSAGWSRIRTGPAIPPLKPGQRDMTRAEILKLRAD